MNHLQIEKHAYNCQNSEPEKDLIPFVPGNWYTNLKFSKLSKNIPWEGFRQELPTLCPIDPKKTLIGLRQFQIAIAFNWKLPNLASQDNPGEQLFNQPLEDHWVLLSE